MNEAAEFRGKPIKAELYGLDFVYGDLIHRGVHAYILPKTTVCSWSPEGKLTTTPIEVHRDTVGQYTGRKDKNGVKIFKHDKIRFIQCLFNTKEENFPVREEVVKWDEFRCGWTIDPTEAGRRDIEVIGTIHDKEKTVE